MMVIEAMKMEHTIAAPRDGTVAGGALRAGRPGRGGRGTDRAGAKRPALDAPRDDGVGGPSEGPLHLLKMAVGVGDLDELRRFRAARIKQRGGSWVYTRNHPRRAEAVLAGGSIYWVIRGQIRVRQRVTGFPQRARRERPGLLPDRGRAGAGADCWRPWRPFQGWRYLTPADAPPDAPHGYGPGGIAPMPERMLAELRALGLF